MTLNEMLLVLGIDPAKPAPGSRGMYFDVPSISLTDLFARLGPPDDLAPGPSGGLTLTYKVPEGTAVIIGSVNADEVITRAWIIQRRATYA